MNNRLAQSNDSVRALSWTPAGLSILDQRLLPGEVRFELFERAEGVAEAIRSMRVRGAPAIGIAAAFGVVLAARHRYARNPEHWRREIMQDLQTLAGSRPTAVNLFWALERMRQAFGEIQGEPEPVLLERAKAIHEADIEGNKIMGELGSDILADARGVLTHCNTGSLATGGYGTALGVIRSAVRKGLERIFATETRPWNQGARLTLWELQQDGIPATLIADSCAATILKSGRVQWVIVGADRIAANGDVANKIGTYSLAVLARYHKVRFMVVAPVSTIDPALADGGGIRIEERERSELLPRCFRDDPGSVDAWNPVFDVTLAELVDVLVTERGVVQHPDQAGIERLLSSQP
ncbi:MAG: S-methyl-5-thioribose-1-phosphate isomerase [Methylococcaceae bacterium]|nr:S-methyl-5-thioribose-1-phosphate isomerase [Methylococcaceae bacterium]